jgi:hypothetical protein
MSGYQKYIDGFSRVLLCDGRPYAGLFIVALGLAFTAILSWCIYTTEPWVVGDWLINYVFGGFKRRGLAGTFTVLAHAYASIPLRVTIFCIVWGFYAAFLWNLYLLLKQHFFPAIFYLLFIAPLGFLFGINAVSAMCRKDTIILLLFTWMLRRRIDFQENNGLFAAFLVIWAVSIVHYEVLIFYFPWFCYLLWTPNNSRKSIGRIGALAVVTAIVTGLIFYFGRNTYSPDTNAYVLESGLDPNVLTGMLTWSDHFDPIQFLKDHWGDFRWYLLSWGICISGYLGLHLLLDQIESAKRNLRIYLACFVLSLPLFLIGIDWGRWMYLHYILLVLVTISEAKNVEFKIYSKPVFVALFFVAWFCQAVFISTPNTDIGIRFDTAFTAVWRYFWGLL